MITKLKPGGIADSALTQVGSLTKATGHEFIKAAKDTIDSVGKQVNPLENLEKQNDSSDSGPARMTDGRNQSNDDLIREMYAPSQSQKKPVKQTLTSIEQLQMLNPFAKHDAEKVVKNPPKQTFLETLGILPTKDPNSHKSPEDVQKMEALKQQLHKQNYFDPVFNRQVPERAEEQQEKQENKADKMNRLKQEDLQKKQEEDEKKKPIQAVVNAETARERRPGAG